MVNSIINDIYFFFILIRGITIIILTMKIMKNSTIT